MLTFVVLYLLSFVICLAVLLYDFYFIWGFDITSGDLKEMVFMSLFPLLNIIFATLVFFSGRSDVLLIPKHVKPLE